MQPFYVGKGSGSRYKVHLNETFENTENRKKYGQIQGIRNKGKEPIVDVIKRFSKEEDAYEFETKLIKTYGRKDIDPGGILCNICEDNRPPRVDRSGWKPSKETRKKWSKQRKGRPSKFKGTKRPELMGENNGFYGKTHTTESRKKMSEKRAQQEPPMR